MRRRRVPATIGRIVAVIGFETVEKVTTNGKTTERVLSRRYPVKEAAEEFAELARKGGCDALVRVLQGMSQSAAGNYKDRAMGKQRAALQLD
jgi:hypothetical protein